MDALTDARPRRAARPVLRAAALAAASAAFGASMALASPVPIRCDPAAPCLAIRNAHLRADISDLGTYALGTTGGDPTTPDDDDKALLYDFRPGGLSDVGTGFPTIHLRRPGGAVENFTPSAASEVTSQTVAPDARSATTVWQPSLPGVAVRITQTLALEENPFTGRLDVLRIGYAVRNEGAQIIDAGVRALLDIRMGRNDGAPYFIPGTGTITNETAYAGDDVPPYWVAFESATYDPSGLRAIGLIDDPDGTAPDAIQFVRWQKIQSVPWDYPIDAAESITEDSAVALIWQPVALAPGAERRVDTRYGLAGKGGGLAFIVAPVAARCGESFVASLFVSNFDVAPLTGGVATLAVPAGLRLAAGEPASKPMARIEPGSAGSVSWNVEALAGASGTAVLTATARFDGGRELTATRDDLVLQCPTATATTRPSPTATTQPITPTPSGGPPGACAFIIGRVPPAVIADALANPASYHGWGMRVNPGLPPSPANPLRTQLSLHNIGVPYHPINNTVRWKGGCP